ncbi:hypothetical protein GUJ93_ZPchr0006g41154 [Zizania palustris]|uniref:RING-type domain-containing protein n=1 Tax=Zizania palustris TaxID=103762 RepID=A0A8J5TAL5_ZIZPA|nr:hypothetical protein GUJ93_ZPchr0006g41154 [Zizania palustris]
MAPPAVAGETAAAADQESAWTDGKGRRRWRHDCAGAGARLLSLVVQAAVMYAALALFLLFAAAATVLLLHLVVVARAFRNQQYRGSRYRVPHASPTPPSRLGLSPADLRLLPCFAAASYSPCDHPSSSQLCAVCLETALEGERWRALPACGHAFHAACVDRWLARTVACPVCRTTVTVSVR